MRIATGLLAALLVYTAWAAEPAYPTPGNTTGDLSRLELFKQRIPVLTHPRGDRWPMILWEAISFEPQSKEVYQALLARGLTQHIRMDAKMIPTALALQAAGSPVIMMQGAGGNWPLSLAGEKGSWRHQYDDGYTPNPKSGYGTGCIAMYEGYGIAADQVRSTLRQFKEAGVTVDAVWMDWEGEPLGAWLGYENAVHCKRCRATLPAEVLATPQAYKAYSARLYVELVGAYLAGPVLEVYPKCSVCNWMNVYSTPEHPVLHWNSRKLPPGTAPIFNATNPVAYGNNMFFQDCWQKEWPLDREHVDTFYFHLLVRQITANAANCEAFAPEKQAIPWVVRYCPDINDVKLPIPSRERYRESLRHLWLRGVDGMQIFNASRKGYEDLVLNEVVDAVQVYDELLAYKPFLDKGEIMNLAMPGEQDDGVVWSGLRLGDRAVVRVFKQGGGEAQATLEPWPGVTWSTTASGIGETWVLEKAAGGVTVISREKTD